MARRYSSGIALLAFICLAGCDTGISANPLNLPSAAKTTWQREGTVISGTAAEEYSVQEPTVLYEDSSVIFGGQAKVFKMWHTCGWSTGRICYAESKDGINFTRYNGGQPIISEIGRPFVLHVGSTYYLYATLEVAGTGWSRYESSDGVNWKLTAPDTLTTGDAPWDKLSSGNIYVWIEDSTWYAMFEAMGTDLVYRTGLAVSPDGIKWTKSAKNPVIAFPYCGGPEIHKVADTYFMWGQCTQQKVHSSDIYRLHSKDLLTWTPDLFELVRETPDEGPGDDNNGQVADPSMVEVNGVVFMYYSATRTQTPDAQSAIHLKVAVTKMSMAALAAVKP